LIARIVRTIIQLFLFNSDQTCFASYVKTDYYCCYYCVVVVVVVVVVVLNEFYAYNYYFAI